MLLHAPSHITFPSSLTELKLAQTFFSFRNLSHALSYCYSKIKTPDSDASIPLLALTSSALAVHFQHFCSEVAVGTWFEGQRRDKNWYSLFNSRVPPKQLN